MPRGKISLPMTIGEHQRVLTVMSNLLVVDYPSSYNAVIRQPARKALKAITFIYHLTMRFATTEGIRYVRGSQYDSQQCYNQLVRMASNKRRLP